jgi:hypothetical protein
MLWISLRYNRATSILHPTKIDGLFGWRLPGDPVQTRIIHSLERAGAIEVKLYYTDTDGRFLSLVADRK